MSQAPVRPKPSLRDRAHATLTRFAPGLAVVVLGTACGGGGGSSGSGGSADPSVQVGQITVGAVRFGQVTEFVVTGSGLANRATHTFSGSCTPSPADDRTISDAELRLHCTPDELGIMTLSIYAPGSTDRVAWRDVLIDKPQVKLSVGPVFSPQDITITLDPGIRGSSQRVWVNNFLYYANSGYYTGKIFHRVNRDILVAGGCYADTLSPGTAAAAPLTPSVPVSLFATNDQYSFAMVPQACGPGYTAFALNLADNSAGKTPDQDQQKYVVIGRYDALDATAVSQLSALPNTWNGFLQSPVPDDRSLATIRGALQTR